MTSLRVAYSTESDPRLAARELGAVLGSPELSFLLFFASSSFDPEILAESLGKVFQGVPSLGCTTAGEIASSKMLKNSIVMLAAEKAAIPEAHVELIRHAENPEATVAALGQLEKGIGQPLGQLSPDRHLGLVLHDGLSIAEEAIMSRLSALTNVPFVGGSAGDDMQFKRTLVFENFRPHQGASALALLAPANAHRVLKTQSFDVQDAVLEVTSADASTRTIHTFNGRPAVEEYASTLGVSVSALPDHFRSHPLGLVVDGGEPFVRSPRQIRDQSIDFFCQVKTGTKLHLLKSRDIVQQTQRDLRAALAEFGDCRAIVNFHCILRTLELEARGQIEDYAALFRSIPTIGFSTYGESYIGHINQTSTMVLLA